MIGGFFRRLPIRHKLVAMIMLTSGTALLLASLGYLATDYYQTREDIEQDVQAQASMIAENSGAALDFLDPQAAEDTLKTLSTNVHIRRACLYKLDGTIFAQYEAPRSVAPCPSSPGPDGWQMLGDRLLHVEGVHVQGRRVGTLLMRSDLEVLQTRVRLQGMIVGLLLMATLGVALLLSARLQAIVSAPMASLARTAADVSSRGDYSLRASRTTDDELGVLVDGFNRMLDRIQLHEGELSRTNDELRKEIVERRRVEQERAELLVREREANRLKDEFLATLSHELRTPLNAILGWTRLLRSKAVPPSGVDRALEKVERNAQVQSRLVEDLLEVSRIVSGKLRLEIKPLDLAALTTTAIESIRPAAEARGVAIDRQFQSYSLATAGDPDRLQQVIWNLLSNAVKFTPAGGVVVVRLERQGTHDHLVVSDTGIGIDPAFLPNVFDTFRQADASSTRTHGGLGLGLSIVKNLVDMHGGDVTASSHGHNTGATFIVRLPVRLQDVERVTAPVVRLADAQNAVIERQLAGKTIVVVDDDDDTRELLQSILEAAGAQVRLAGTAEEGFTACLEERPDALVSDIAMPGQDGYALMRHLQTALGADAPRVSIALTAFAGPRDCERSAQAGFHRHVAKPFDPRTLVDTLQDLLEGGSAPVQ